MTSFILNRDFQRFLADIEHVLGHLTEIEIGFHRYKDNASRGNRGVQLYL